MPSAKAKSAPSTWCRSTTLECTSGITAVASGVMRGPSSVAMTGSGNAPLRHRVHARRANEAVADGGLQLLERVRVLQRRDARLLAQHVELRQRHVLALAGHGGPRRVESPTAPS